MTTRTDRHLEHEGKAAMNGVRGALLGLYASVDSDPLAPQVVSRRFGLNRNLCWKIAKIVEAEDPLTAIQHLPGSSGVDILLTTMASHGAPPMVVESVRAALQEFDRFVVEHAGGRDDLDLMLDSMGLIGADRQLEASRELAYRGNSGIFGIQAKVRVTTAIMFPSQEAEGLADSVLVGGFIGLRRLRPTVRWPLFRFGAYSGRAGVDIDTKAVRVENPDAPRLLSKFSTHPPGSIEMLASDRWNEYVLNDGQVGNRGVLDCFFRSVARKFPMHAVPGDSTGEITSAIALPIDYLLLDVLYHRSFSVPSPQLLVFAKPGGGLDDPASRRDENLLPISQRVTSLDGLPHAAATAVAPRYQEMLCAVCAEHGLDPREFRGHRLVLRWPPMPSVVALRWALPDRAPSRTGL